MLIVLQRHCYAVMMMYIAHWPLMVATHSVVHSVHYTPFRRKFGTDQCPRNAGPVPGGSTANAYEVHVPHTVRRHTTTLKSTAIEQENGAPNSAEREHNARLATQSRLH